MTGLAAAGIGTIASLLTAARGLPAPDTVAQCNLTLNLA